MSQLQDIQGLVSIAIGGRADSTAVTIIQAAINYAITLASIIFRPPELRSLNNFNFTGGAAYLDISSVNWLDIQAVKNTTDEIGLKFIPYERLDIIVPSSLTTVKYYSLFGDRLFLRASPSSTKALELSCLTVPSTLSDPSDPIPFDSYDSFLVAWASSLVQAMFEELESAVMWQKLHDAITQIHLLGTKERDVLEGQQAYFDAIATQAQGGR